MASIEEKPTAEVFVQASGRNMRPSCASSRNTGRKETTMMSNEKNSAGQPALPRRSGCAGAPVQELRSLSRMLREMAISVFHHHDCRIHQHSDGQRQPAQ